MSGETRTHGNPTSKTSPHISVIGEVRRPSHLWTGLSVLWHSVDDDIAESAFNIPIFVQLSTNCLLQVSVDHSPVRIRRVTSQGPVSHLVALRQFCFTADASIYILCQSALHLHEPLLDTFQSCVNLRCDCRICFLVEPGIYVLECIHQPLYQCQELIDFSVWCRAGTSCNHHRHRQLTLVT